MQMQQPRRPVWWQRILQSFLGIRGKIVLPYMFLTLIVAIVGTYVVTSLVADSLDERLENHLLDAGRTVSDSMAFRELDHLETARLVAFTRGLPQALAEGEAFVVADLASPAVASQGVEYAAIVDAVGAPVLLMLKQDDGSYASMDAGPGTSNLWMVQSLLESDDPDALPRRGIVQDTLDGRYYYLTAIPIAHEGDVVGVVVVGSSLDELVTHFESTSLAHVSIYLSAGPAAATTFQFLEESEGASISEERYLESLYSDDFTIGDNISVLGRWYRIARGPLRVGDERLAVFSVALPSSFIVRAGATSRNTYALLFTAAMGCVILVGYFISQRITSPLSRLVRTSQAVADGDLRQRTGIASSDEIGVLAETFDEMTGRLEKRTEELEETAGRLTAILSSIGDGVVLEDNEGSFIPLNTTAEALLAEMSAGFHMRPLRELSGDEDEWASDAQPNPWMLEQRRFQVGEKTVSVHSAAVRTEDGERLGTVIVLRDVTAEVEADRLKDAFVTHVSHELRTPLTAIQGYTQLLLSGAGGGLDDNQRGFLQTIHRHTDSLVEMISGLLDFSEMEAGRELGLRRRPVQLSNLVEMIASEWGPQMEAKSLAFDVEIGDDLPKVNADIRRLRWAIVNLVRNAYQHTPDEGKVSVRLISDGDRVILSVADNGVGISPEDQERLFSRFYRITHEDDDVRGLGLGLYVAKVIVEAHEGEIEAMSEKGVGSTFKILLPALQ